MRPFAYVAIAAAIRCFVGFAVGPRRRRGAERWVRVRPIHRRRRDDAGGFLRRMDGDLVAVPGLLRPGRQGIAPAALQLRPFRRERAGGPGHLESRGRGELPARGLPRSRRRMRLRLWRLLGGHAAGRARRRMLAERARARVQGRRILSCRRAGRMHGYVRAAPARRRSMYAPRRLRVWPRLRRHRPLRLAIRAGGLQRRLGAGMPAGRRVVQPRRCSARLRVGHGLRSDDDDLPSAGEAR